MKDNKIICGDCLEVMKDWPDNCVDLVLTDPPYFGLKGTARHWGNQGVAPTNERYASVGDIWKANLDWVSEAWRISSLGMLSFCSYHFVAELGMLLPAENRVALFTWDKIVSPVPVHNVPHFVSEFIWAWKKRPGLKWCRIKTVLRECMPTAGCISTGERFTKPDGKSLHPAQKPISLMLKLLSIGGESVIDIFCGLGTTCVAAKMLGRRYIGIDISEKYCQIARQRLEAVETGVPVKEQRVGQMPLFK